MSVETPVVVIGAGPAGLAVSRSLQKNDVAHVVLERADRVASTWHRHYRRLHLHTVKLHSALPDRAFGRDIPSYPSRQQVVDYLTDYAATFEIEPRFGVEVTSAERVDDRWTITTAEETYRADALVVATGYNGVPNVPDIPGLPDFDGPVIHSREYLTGADFSGKRVLVVGCGNSGAEIVLDLFESGARPSMVVRGPVHVVPRDLFGRPSQATSIALSKLPARIADALTTPILKLAVGDLSKYGIVRPKVGPRTMIETVGRVPILDIGTIALVKRGDADVVPAVTRIEGVRVFFEDGTERAYDGIVLATGYRCGLDRFLVDAPRVTSRLGRPNRHGAEAELPGLYFVGFRNPPTGALREIALEAPRVAADIRRKMRA